MNDRHKKHQFDEERPTSVSTEQHKKRHKRHHGDAESDKGSRSSDELVAQSLLRGQGIQQTGSGSLSVGRDVNLVMNISEPCDRPVYDCAHCLKDLRSIGPGDDKKHTEDGQLSDSCNIDATTKQSLIDQLYFTKIDERLTNLTAAQGRTCRWFLTKPEYTSWHDVAQLSDHGGFLWIKGNPGTGKSTLMKLLFEDAQSNAKHNHSKIVLSFFFLARGTVEEKSTIGLYRALLHQLFQKVPDLTKSLEWMTADGARVIRRSGWSEGALKQTLTHAVRKLGNKSLTIFVDALDECEDSQVKGMICFFEELCDLARNMQICFSSRHYPHIEIKKGTEVILEGEDGHKEDIEQYIGSKLRLRKTKKAESLQSEILKKSSRIFLWVVLVVDILNNEYPAKPIEKMRKRLEEIPEKLSDLFEMILTRDGQNLAQLKICLQWVLFATRPLKPQELYFAIQLGEDKECSTYWNKEDVELDQIKAFVRSSSKGLAEVTRNKASEVQFIHESVRDFLLGKYRGQWSGASGNFVGHGHEVLRDCCLAQLNAPINQYVDIPDPLPEASKAAQLRETIGLKLPFLGYSVLNVLHHANGAQQQGMEQRGFLTDFPRQRWIFFHNTLERYNIRRYRGSASLPYILAEKNLADLIRIHPPRESCFDVEDERYGPPIFAALATGSNEAVQTLLEIQARIRPLESPLHELCKRYSENGNKRITFGSSFTFSPKKGILFHVLEQGDEDILAFLYTLGKVDAERKDKAGRTPLSWVAERGYEAIVKLLLETGKVDVDSKDQDGRTPLSWAARNGNETVVKLLLETGKVNVDSKDQYGWTPLWWAARKGHEAVVKVLLEISKAGVDSKDKQNGQTPLSWAAQNGNETVVKVLLGISKAGIDSNDKQNGQTPLSWAAQNEYETVVKLLLETGKVDVDSKDQDGQTPLSWATEYGNETVVKLLLETGKVDVDSKNRYGQTPLSWAAEYGNETVVKLLLETGKVDVDSKNRYGRTPLWWAVWKGNEAVVKILLETGKVDVDPKDRYGRTPLSWAARNGNETVVKLLLETGKVDVDSKDQDGQTPLSWAAQYGNETVVKLLLETGKVDVDSRDRDGRTPLSWAAQYGNETVVKLLLETGKVNVNSKDQDGQTPLSWAARNGHKTVAKILLEKGAKES